MSESFPSLNVSPLREYEFQSNTPVVGPLIVKVRRALYSLTAKWPLRVALDQQTRINQQLVQRLHEYEERLIDQDRDLAHLSRVTAEVELRLRYLSQHQIPPQS
jgi:hypothetical protein